MFRFFGLFRLAIGSILFLGFIFFAGKSFSQVVIWTENFNNGCASNCVANTWNSWTIVDNDGGATGGAPNNWFVSCAEEGVAPPGCGSSCIGDASLHIGANPGAGGDMGASFNETGATNATFRLAVSPTISTVGYSSNTLQFDFIAFGSSACSDDRAQLRLSTDNGATWPAGFQYCLNSVCCGACNGYSQGQWTLYTLALPAAFDNNPNVRVGFHWRNNGNGAGTDPSVAVDDIRITTVVAPVNLMKFSAVETDSKVKLNWIAGGERHIDHYEIEKSDHPGGFKTIGVVDSRGGSPTGLSEYAFNDPQSVSQDAYYRLKMVDYQGHFETSQVVRVTPGSTVAVEISDFMPMASGSTSRFTLWAAGDFPVSVEMVDLNGKTVLPRITRELRQGENPISLDISSLSASVYFLQVKTLETPQGFAPQIIREKIVKTK